MKPDDDDVLQPYFLKNKDNVKAYCQTTVKPNFLLPMALHIIQGLWVIALQKEMRFSVTCPEDKRSIFIPGPFRHNKTRHVLFCN